MVLVRDCAELEANFFISKKHLDAYDRIKTKPLTLILESKTIFPDRYVSAEGRVAVRVSSNRFVEEMFNYLDDPIISTSANVSEKENLFDIKDIINVFIGKVELIADSGNLPPSKGSTIVDLTVSPAKIIRKGDINASELEEFLQC